MSPTSASTVVARRLISNGDMANVEIKPTPGTGRETGLAVAREAAKLWAGAKTPPLLSSFDFDALMAAKEAAPELPRAWLVDKFTEAEWGRLEQLQAVSLNTNHKKFDVADVARLRARGYRVMLYTVNDVAMAARLFEAGVDSLFTDNLEVFAERFPQMISGG